MLQLHILYISNNQKKTQESASQYIIPNEMQFKNKVLNLVVSRFFMLFVLCDRRT